MLSRNVETFLGCDNEYEQSKIVIFGAPFDSTASYRPGARFASRVMRSESYALETYSPYQNKGLEEIAVFDGGDLELPFGNTEKALQIIERFTDKLMADNKLPVMIGGEHLVALGAVRSVLKKYPDLHIVHFDAHADLRDDYLGEKLSHSTVIRRIWDYVGNNKIYQFGIRSGDKSEFIWAENHVFMQKYNFLNLCEAIKKINDRPVYFTIDLDVLDPSVFPGTGTPEPGGIAFTELIDAVIKVCELNIVGCDINELSPNNDPSGISTITACKVLRELILALS